MGENLNFNRRSKGLQRSITFLATKFHSTIRIEEEEMYWPGVPDTQK